MDNNLKILVTGAGGFIGGSLIALLRKQGRRDLRAIDIKPFDQWDQHFDDVENLSLDLNLRENRERAAEGASDIYNLAANMGGRGFIEANKALCVLSVLINTHMLQAAVKHGAKRFFYASSACVYNGDKQKNLRGPFVERGRRLPRAGRRRLRLGETFFRTYVPAFPGGFQAIHTSGALSQCLRAVGNVVWRARKGPRSNLPKGDRSKDLRET